MKRNFADNLVLVIEDYAVMRKSIKHMLNTINFQYIFEAENGVAAISAMEKQRFDIVICDYHLGDGKNGQQILEEARYKKLISFDTLFIIISSHQTTNFVLSTIEIKPDEYLTKPFNPQQLLRRIEKSQSRKKHIAQIERELDKENPAKAIQQCDYLLEQSQLAYQSALHKIRAELAIHIGDFEKASQIYQSTLQKRDLVWAKIGLGIVAYHKQQFAQAIETFENIIEDTPMMIECYHWLSLCYQSQDRNSDALKILARACELSPNSLSSQKKLAHMALQQQNYRLAEKAYQSVVQLGKHSIHKTAADYSGLAKTHLKNLNKKQVLKTLEQMRNQFPENPEAEIRANALKSELFHHFGETEKSAQAYDKLQQLAKKAYAIPRDLQLDIAKAHYIQNDLAAAEKIIRQLVPNQIDDDEFMQDVRQLLQEVGQSEQTENLIEESQHQLKQINNKGVALFQQGNYSDASKIFQTAIKKMPLNKTLLLNLAKTTLQEMKTQGVSKDKLLLAYHTIKTAKQVGLSSEKLGNLQFEFESITQSNSAEQTL